GGLTRARQARDLCVSLGVAMTIEDTWGGDIVTAAIAHLAQSTPEQFRFTATDFNSYVTVGLAEGAPKRVNGRMAAPTGPGLGIQPRPQVLGQPVIDSHCRIERGRIEMKANWQGVFPACTTHFKADQSIDFAATAAHIERQLRAGVRGFIMLGTVGENCSLDADEKRQVLKLAVDTVKGRGPVLAGTAECTTALALPYCADPKKVGLDRP